MVDEVFFPELWEARTLLRERAATTDAGR
jgi:hypothetical protein